MKKGKRIAFYSICIVLSSMILVKLSSCGFGNKNPSFTLSGGINESTKSSENQSTDYSNSLSLSESVSSSSGALISSSSASEEPLSLKRMTFNNDVNFEGIDLNYLETMLNNSSSVENVLLATYYNEFDGTSYNYILNNIAESNGYKVISLRLNDKAIEYTTIAVGNNQTWRLAYSGLDDLSFDYTKVEIKNSMYLVNLSPFTNSNLNPDFTYNLSEYDISNNYCYFNISLRFGSRMMLKFEIPLGFDVTIYKQKAFLKTNVVDDFIEFYCLDDSVTNLTIINIDNYGSILNSNYDYYLKGANQVNIDNSLNNLNIDYSTNDISSFKLHVNMKG